MKEFIRVMKALSDPNRVKLLKMLQKRTMCVCEVRAALGIAQPTVSKHLSILEEAGWVDKKRQGRNFIFYHLIEGLTPEDHRAALLALLRPWLLEDSELTALSCLAQDLNPEEILRGAEKSRSGLCRECGVKIVPAER